jgi:hypothetical protein
MCKFLLVVHFYYYYYNINKWRHMNYELWRHVAGDVICGSTDKSDMSDSTKGYMVETFRYFKREGKTSPSDRINHNSDQ